MPSPLGARPAPRDRPAMSDPVNIRLVKPGTHIVLADGTRLEVTDNPQDGVWLFARDADGGESMVFAQDVARIEST